MRASVIANGIHKQRRCVKAASDRFANRANIAERALARLRVQPIDMDLLEQAKPNKPATLMTDSDWKVTAAHALARLAGVGPYANPEWSTRA